MMAGKKRRRKNNKTFDSHYQKLEEMAKEIGLSISFIRSSASPYDATFILWSQRFYRGNRIATGNFWKIKRYLEVYAKLPAFI